MPETKPLGEVVDSSRGRIGLLHHEKALVMTPTLFSQEDYEADWQEPIRRIICHRLLRDPGVKQVERVYFYRAAIADQQTIDAT
jgi:NAD(P)H dehydrogenase (quinone)